MKIGIFGSSFQTEEQIREIFRILNEHEMEIYIHPEFYEYVHTNFQINCLSHQLIDVENFSADIALSVGGDGTFLRTASIISQLNIPILGINTGRLGFLAETNEHDLEQTLAEIFSGEYSVEKRMLLEVVSENGLIDDNRFALNEIAILKQDSAAMLTIHAEINGEYLNSYQSDGLIVATPTGSTAYSLSVGGPILAPGTESMILAPIAPHSLNVRPLVVSDTSQLRLTIESRNNNFLASIDGRSTVLNSKVIVNIKKADFSLNVIKRKNNSFYRTLREKLMWGADVRGDKNG